MWLTFNDTHARDVILVSHVLVNERYKLKIKELPMSSFGITTNMADESHVKNNEIVKSIKEKAKSCCDSPKYSNNILDILSYSQVLLESNQWEGK